jgi:membrane associated rhomboid family serine protease
MPALRGELHLSSQQQDLPQNGQISPQSPAINLPLVVGLTVGVLVAVHIARNWISEDVTVWSIYLFTFSPMRFNPANAIPFVAGSQWWSFLTYAFLHADWAHLLFNSIWLVIFGTPVARLFGAWRFLLIAALAAIAGAVAHLLVHWPDRTYLLGASGAVSGLLGAALPIMHGRGNIGKRVALKQTLSLTEYLQSGQALIFTLMWFALQLVPQFFVGLSAIMTDTAFLGERPVAWEAHVGGFLAGLALFFLLRSMHLSRQSRS